MVELVGGGSVINGGTRSSFLQVPFINQAAHITCQRVSPMCTGGGCSADVLVSSVTVTCLNYMPLEGEFEKRINSYKIIGLNAS